LAEIWDGSSSILAAVKAGFSKNSVAKKSEMSTNRETKKKKFIFWLKFEE
jgi:hypothetical protein